jgi:hypothetical protein
MASPTTCWRWFPFWIVRYSNFGFTDGAYTQIRMGSYVRLHAASLGRAKRQDVVLSPNYGASGLRRKPSHRQRASFWRDARLARFVRSQPAPWH